MPDTPDLKFAIGLPPERAIAYFQAKGYEITFDWHELLADAQAKSFATRYYTAHLHTGVLVAPPFVAEALGE